METVAFVIRLLLGSVFLMAALPKGMQRRAFIDTVLSFHVLSPPLARLFGATLPWLELVAAVLLLSGFLSRVAAGVIGILVLGFMVAVGIAMKRGSNLDCSCFGLLYRERVGWATQARDAVLFLMALSVFFRPDPFSALHLIQNSDEPRVAVLLALLLTVIAVSSIVSIVSVRSQRRERITRPAPVEFPSG